MIFAIKWADVGGPTRHYESWGRFGCSWWTNPTLRNNLKFFFRQNAAGIVKLFLVPQIRRMESSLMGATVINQVCLTKSVKAAG
jgi:hypothetical protein